jgi:hypothetical protein
MLRPPRLYRPFEGRSWRPARFGLWIERLVLVAVTAGFVAGVLAHVWISLGGRHG